MKGTLAAVLAALAGFSATCASALADESPAPIERAGGVEKVCQLTGETDWRTGLPTAARTFSNFGLDATDLGYPVERGEKLILLFGDSWPPRHPAKAIEDAIPGDAVGLVTRKDPPSADGGCLGLQINVEPGPDRAFAPASVVGPIKVDQGFFNVPSGGVSVDDRLYAFFWTDHCSLPTDLEPSADQPLLRPAPTRDCPEADGRNSVGRGVVAWSSDEGRTFSHVAAMPPGFVYASGVDPLVERAPTIAAEPRLYVFGVPRYRASVPYLAETTPHALGEPTSWRFFAGLDAAGQPRWASYREWLGGDAAGINNPATWRPPGTPQIFSDDSGSQACVGEFSITYNRPLGRWLLLYNCRGEIMARVAKAPWGPWSDPTSILGPSDDVRCQILMSPGGCDGRRDFWASRSRNGRIVPGGLYAPFVLNRFTSPGDAPGRSANIYFLVSTWNPYEVTLMKATLRATD